MRHNAGYEKFTSTGMPWSLIWHISKPTKSEAYQLELKLKKLIYNDRQSLLHI
jgi:predicted GIY-YIG superfamily endonuclease